MRRSLLRAALFVALFGGVYACASYQAAKESDAPVKVAEGVWFQNYTTDLGKPTWQGSNVFWIEFADYVAFFAEIHARFEAPA